MSLNVVDTEKLAGLQIDATTASESDPARAMTGATTDEIDSAAIDGTIEGAEEGAAMSKVFLLISIVNLDLCILPSKNVRMH
jgi:hypothetical protein